MAFHRLLGFSSSQSDNKWSTSNVGSPLFQILEWNVWMELVKHFKNDPRQSKNWSRWISWFIIMIFTDRRIKLDNIHVLTDAAFEDVQSCHIAALVGSSNDHKREWSKTDKTESLMKHKQLGSCLIDENKAMAVVKTVELHKKNRRICRCFRIPMYTLLWPKLFDLM